MSSDRSQRPWSSGYLNSNSNSQYSRDPNSRSRIRTSQSSEQHQRNQSIDYHSFYTDRYTPSTAHSRRAEDSQPNGYNPRRTDGTQRDYYQNPSFSSHPRNSMGQTERQYGSSRSFSNRGGAFSSFSYQDYYHPYNNNGSNGGNINRRFHGQRRSNDGYNKYRQVNTNTSRSNSQTNNTYHNEDFYDGTYQSTSTNSYKPNDSKLPKKQSLIRSKDTNEETDPGNSEPETRSNSVITSKPSLIPKDFKDEDNDELDEKQWKSQIASEEPTSKVEAKNDVISERIPLTVEHKEELDEHLAEDSREPSGEAPDQDDVKMVDLDQVETMQKLEVSETVVPQVLVVEQKSIISEVEESESRERSPSEESDSYDPIETALMKSQTQIVEEKKEPAIKEEVKPAAKVIVPLEKIDSCIFPLPRVEYKAWELRNHPKEEVAEALPYLLKKPIKDFKEYPFYHRNFLVHEQVMKPKLQENLSIIKKFTLTKKSSLLNEYSHRLDDWNKRLEKMSIQLKSFYPQLENETDNSSTVAQSEVEPEKPTTSRRGRYHGDTVRSEAEFLEILKNLEKEKDDDPLYRAEQVAAHIPDMILNPVAKNLKFINVNNLVLDKEEWANRIKTDPVDNFTKREHELFCEAFLSHPKKFGRISVLMGGLRTAEECVLHYYKTKKSLTDYKQLLALKKKKNRKGGKSRRGPKPKGLTDASTPNTPATETPGESGDELGLENFIPKEANEEVLYTETGRRRRAAAPVFDSKEKRDEASASLPPAPPPTAVPPTTTSITIGSEERKRSMESTNASDAVTGEAKTDTAVKVKKQRGPKPKKPVPENNNSEAPKGTETDGASMDGKIKGGITSYWSVKDINLFAVLLEKYGAKWNIIAEELKTKSPIMVRNYFHRNADRHGWRQLAGNIEGADSSLGQLSGAQQHQQSHQHISQQPQQVQQPITPATTGHKNPPLGFFTAQSNVPSNLSFPPPMSEGPTLPKLENMISHVSVPPPPPPNVMPQLSTFHTNKEPIARSSPFSITSLLNPSEERRTAPVLPLAGTFDDNRKPYAAYTNHIPPQQNGSSSLVKLLNEDQRPGANPLDTLVAAANPWAPQQGGSGGHRQTASLDSIRPLFGRDTPIYAGGYQAPYSESSERNRSILNDTDSPPIIQPKPHPVASFPPIGSRGPYSTGEGENNGEKRQSL